MALYLSIVAENKGLECMLGKSTPGNLTLKLFVNDHTLSDDDVAVAVSEVQTITVDATGGTFTVTWSGQTTVANAFNIAAATLQTNLENLSNIAPGDVVVTGGPGAAGGGTPYTLTWNKELGDVVAPTTNPASLTGGAGTANVATSVPGAKGFTEMSTQGYASKTLTMATWAAAAQVASKASISYGSEQSWTFNGTGGDTTVYGYYVIDGAGVLRWAERFTSARLVRNNGDQLAFTPKLTLSRE